MRLNIMHDDESNIWLSFIEDECDGNNGLLCFYDADKSLEVVFFCRVLAGELTAFLDEKSSIDNVSERSG